MDDIQDQRGKVPERVLKVRDSGLVNMFVVSSVAMLALGGGLWRAWELRRRARMRRGRSRRWIVDPTLVIIGPDGLRVENDHRRIKMVERSERVSEEYDAPRRIKVLVQEKDRTAWQLRDALEFTHPELGYWAPRIYVLPDRRLEDQEEEE
jgi:hypothetical protein